MSVTNNLKVTIDLRRKWNYDAKRMVYYTRDLKVNPATCNHSAPDGGDFTSALFYLQIICDGSFKNG